MSSPSFCSSRLPRPPETTLFPYTTLFRSANAAHRDARLCGDRRLDHSDCAQNLDLMPGHGSDHSSLFPRKRSAAASPGSSVTSEPVWTGQNFLSEVVRIDTVHRH